MPARKFPKGNAAELAFGCSPVGCVVAIGAGKPFASGNIDEWEGGMALDGATFGPGRNAPLVGTVAGTVGSCDPPAEPSVKPFTGEATEFARGRPRLPSAGSSMVVGSVCRSMRGKLPIELVGIDRC